MSHCESRFVACSSDHAPFSLLLCCPCSVFPHLYRVRRPLLHWNVKKRPMASGLALACLCVSARFPTRVVTCFKDIHDTHGRQ